MSINVDWRKLRAIHKNLVKNNGLRDDAKVVFLMMLSDGKAKRAEVKFKDFLEFFWALSDNDELNVYTLVVQDKEGRILYRHKRLNASNEEIPDGGNAAVIQHWGALTSEEKETYLRLLVAQVNGYER